MGTKWRKYLRVTCSGPWTFWYLVYVELDLSCMKMDLEVRVLTYAA